MEKTLKPLLIQKALVLDFLPKPLLIQKALYLLFPFSLSVNHIYLGDAPGAQVWSRWPSSPISQVHHLAVTQKTPDRWPWGTFFQYVPCTVRPSLLFRLSLFYLFLQNFLLFPLNMLLRSQVLTTGTFACPFSTYFCKISSSSLSVLLLSQVLTEFLSQLTQVAWSTPHSALAPSAMQK